MKYMLLIKSDARTETGQFPDDKHDEAMGKYNEELREAGIWVTAEGYQASSQGARVTLENGDYTVTRGPFANPEELIAGYWVIDVDSKDEAIAWAKRVPFEVDGEWLVEGTGEIEVRPFIVMPGSEDEQLAFDSGNTPSNGANAKRFIGMIKSDEKIESGEMPPPEVFEAMGAAMEPLMRDGILVAADGLQPTSQGARVNFANGKPPVITDGPFAETKEIVGGYAIMRVPSLDEAVELAKQAMQVEATWRPEPIELEVRELYG
jgi:hypothetical protein